MQKRSATNEKGAILIMAVAGMMAFLIIMALAIDVTYCFIVTNQLRNIADSSAIAAVGAYVNHMTNIQPGANLAVERVAAINQGRQAAIDVGMNSHTTDRPGVGVTIDIADIVFGSYDQNVRQFTVANTASDTINAVRVVVRKDTALNQRYQFYMSMLTRFTDARLDAEAISSLVRKNIVFMMDLSSSMDDNTYPKAYDAIKNARPNGLDYFDFKTYPVPTYAFGADSLGGRPQPMYSLLETVDNFFSQTLLQVLEQNDNVAFLTFNLRVQNRVNESFPGRSFAKRNELSTLAAQCRRSMAFYDTYIQDAMASSGAGFTYNPVVFHYNDLLHFVPYNPANPTVTSIVDRKYNGGYPAGSAMQQLVTDTRLIFPGGRYPSGEDVDRNPSTYENNIAAEGYTNIGGVLARAGEILRTVTSGQVPAFNMVILLTDGLPNVASWGTGGGTAQYETWGRQYAVSSAETLKSGDVRICTIYYRTEQGQVAERGEAFLRDEIASSAEYAMSADNAADVDLILTQLMQTFPYVLVE